MIPKFLLAACLVSALTVVQVDSLGAACTDADKATDCDTSAVPNADGTPTCTDSKCVCAAGFYFSRDGCAASKACTADTDCASDTTLYTGTCTNNFCECASNAYATGSACALLTTACTVATQVAACPAPNYNQVCTNLYCECASGYIPSGSACIALGVSTIGHMSITLALVPWLLALFFKASVF